MNCEQARELAVLAASGDVTPTEGDALELHNAGCAECRAEAIAFVALSGQLASMREQSAPDHVYASVRARVAAEIGEHQRPVWLAAWPAFVAAMACALVLVAVLHPVAPVASLPGHQPATGHVAAIAGVRDEAPVIAAPPVRKRGRRAVVREPAEPLVVQMFTNDPDVVIYWIADAGRQGSKKEIIQ